MEKIWVCENCNQNCTSKFLPAGKFFHVKEKKFTCPHHNFKQVYEKPKPKENVQKKNFVTKAREQLNCSQEKFAQELGVSVTTVWRWEKGIQAPSFFNLQKINNLTKVEKTVVDEYSPRLEDFVIFEKPWIKNLVYISLDYFINIHSNIINKFRLQRFSVAELYSVPSKKYFAIKFFNENRNNGWKITTSDKTNNISIQGQWLFKACDYKIHEKITNMETRYYCEDYYWLENQNMLVVKI